MAEKELRVRTSEALRERLDAFCAESKRNLTNAVNYLLEQALDVEEQRRRNG